MPLLLPKRITKSIYITFILSLSPFVTRDFIYYIFSLKLDCEKLVQEKTEMQRHYVMVSVRQYILPELVYVGCSNAITLLFASILKNLWCNFPLLMCLHSFIWDCVVSLINI